MNTMGPYVSAGQDVDLAMFLEDRLPFAFAHEETDQAVSGDGDGSAGKDAHGAWREAMLVKHLPMVRYLARKMHKRLPKHVEIEELVSAGTLGLIDAIDRFDHGRAVQFNSYAQFRIKGAILDSLRELDWGSRTIRKKGRAIEEATRTLMQQHGREPQEEEIAQQMGMDLSEYQHLQAELKGLEIGSLHDLRHDGEGEEEMVYLAGPEEESPDRTLLQMEQKQELIDIIEELPENERMVLTLYYYEGLALTEIAMVLGVVKSRVSQLHTKALARVKSLLGRRPFLCQKRRRINLGMACRMSAA